MNYLLLATIKIVDNIVGTAKSIATYKEQRLLSSILTTISQLFFYLIISKVIEDNTILAIIIVSCSSGIGNYIAFLINEKFKKDTKWTMVITASDTKELKMFCECLKYKDIKYIVCNGYNRRWKDTMNVIVFSKSKDESRFITQCLKTGNFKYLLEVI